MDVSKRKFTQTLDTSGLLDMQLSQIWGCPPWIGCVTTGTAGGIMTSGWSPCFGTPAAAVGAVGGKVSAAAAFGAATIGATGSRDPIAEGIHVKTQNSLCVNSFFSDST